jgi:signal transduction histidine kinase
VRAAKYITIAGLLLQAFLSPAQTRMIDSLRTLVAHTSSDSIKMAAIFFMAEQNIDADTLLPYVVLAEKIAMQKGNAREKDMAAFSRSLYYTRKNITDSGLAITEALVKKYKDNKERQDLYLKFLFFKAQILDRANQYSKAFAQLFEVIEVAQSMHDTAMQIHAQTGIGWVQMEMEQYNEALKWLYKAKNVSSNPRFYKNYGALYSNIASAYNSLGRADSAMHYINIAIRDARENENMLFLATALSMQAKIFVDNKRASLAEAALHEVLEIRKTMNDPFYVVYDMSSLASYYASNGQSEKGIRICNEGIVIAKKLGLPSQLLMIYRSLAENYKAAGNMQQYGRTLEYIIALKDSFNNINSSKQLAEMQAKNDAQKNETIIMSQRLDLVKKNYLFYGSLLLLLVSGGLFYLFFKEYKKRQRLRIDMMMEEEKRMSAQAVTEAEENQRKRIAADLHDNLGVQANAILYGTELLKNGQEKKEGLVNELHNTAKDMLLSLRETLWAMKNTMITAAELWLRVINFGKQMQRYYPDIKINTIGIAPVDTPLSSAQALHIVLLLQEAVNNAARHAAAKNITVESSGTGNNWMIEIKDDGQGFDLDAAKKKTDSYGLSNMWERAQAAGIVLTINTAPASGTVVTIGIPVTVAVP